jgi:fatty acid desaturase
MSGLTHDGFLASLAPETRAAMTARKDGPGLARLALHLGLIVVLGALIAVGAPGWPVLLVPQGILIVFLFTTMHEAVHRTAFATPWLNEAVAKAAGFVLLIPPEWFRLFHFAHHRHTQDPARDPELATPKPETLAGYVRHVSGLPVWWSALGVLVRNAGGRNRDAFVPGAARPAVRREARAMLAGYAALAALSLLAGSAALVWAWLLPALLGQPFLRLFLLAEHGRCPMVANMFENSRTTFTAHAVRHLAWNMPYHAEHHAWPAVPFHRLPDLHRLTAPHLRVTEDGYARFTRAYAAGLGAGGAARCAAPDARGAGRDRRPGRSITSVSGTLSRRRRSFRTTRSRIFMTPRSRCWRTSGSGSSFPRPARFSAAPGHWSMTTARWCGSAARSSGRASPPPRNAGGCAPRTPRASATMPRAS